MFFPPEIERKPVPLVAGIYIQGLNRYLNAYFREINSFGQQNETQADKKTAGNKPRRLK